MTFIDRDPDGCVCNELCEWPCWQRIGLTDQACCEDCQPLPPLDDESPRPAPAVDQTGAGHG